MEGIQFLLLIDFGGHISSQGNELSDARIADSLAIGLVNGRDMQLEIAMTRGCSFGAATVQTRDGSFAGESGMKRVIVRSERFRRIQGVVKTSAGTQSATPILESRVRPEDPQLGAHHGHAVGQGSENALRLEQVGGPLALV